MMTGEKIHIKTIQPYFVFETDRFYQHIMASYGISHFFSYKIPQNMPPDILMIPDGCSNIIFAYNESDMKAYVLGSTRERKALQFDFRREYFGVRFQPGENPCFAEFPVKYLVNDSAELSEFSSMRTLRSRMESTQSFHERVGVFLQAYRQYLVSLKNTNQHNLFRQIYILISKSNGIITISELEKLTGYSSRYINLIFTEELGISAKQFCRILKFQTIIDRLNSGNIANLSDLAEDFHYYDQSHFIHDFKNFTNITPSEYLKNVRAAEYRSRVVNV
jgi:AraC-like DNA-binding protein